MVDSPFASGITRIQERIERMYKKSALIGCVLLLAAGCASIGNPFSRITPDYSTVPEEELREFAAAVEQFVVKGEREPVFEDFPSIDTENEEITQAIRTRAARAQLLQALLSSGFAYEQRGGTVAILRTREYKKATDKRQRDQNALLVMSENANRWTLYESLVKSSNWPPGALGAVQDAFFEARVALLSPGQKYAGPEGDIVAK